MLPEWVQNHRRAQFGQPKAREISVALPREMEMLEAQIRDIINQYVSRGRLTARVSLHAGASKLSARMHLNVPLAKAVRPGTYSPGRSAQIARTGDAGPISAGTGSIPDRSANR